MLVYTIKGLVPREQLTIRDIEFWESNNRIIHTEWYMGDELVRRDVWVSSLRGIEDAVQGETGNIGG